MSYNVSELGVLVLNSAAHLRLMPQAIVRKMACATEECVFCMKRFFENGSTVVVQREYKARFD